MQSFCTIFIRFRVLVVLYSIYPVWIWNSNAHGPTTVFQLRREGHRILAQVLVTYLRVSWHEFALVPREIKPSCTNLSVSSALKKPHVPGSFIHTHTFTCTCKKQYSDMWQSRVKIEGYSVVYFDHIAAFEVPYRWTSVKGRAHVRFVDLLDIHTSTKHAWAPLRKFSDTALQNTAIRLKIRGLTTRDCHTYNYITQHIIMVSTRRRQEMGGAQSRKEDGMMEESIYCTHIMANLHARANFRCLLTRKNYPILRGKCMALIWRWLWRRLGAFQ